MRRITYMAPVDYMQGKFTTQRDKLRYSPTDTSYFDRDAKQASALNYDKSFVGVHRPGYDHHYYQLKRRSTINPTDEQKLVAAAFKACQQGWSNLTDDTELLEVFRQAWKAKGTPTFVTIRGYFVHVHFDMFRSKRASVAISWASGLWHVNNPYIQGGTGRDVFDTDSQLEPFLRNS